MSKIGPRFKYLEQPIFCLCVIKDYVLVASGGGGKKFGVRNKILSYQILNNYKFSEEPLCSVEFEKEIPVFISSYELLNIFCVSVDNLTVFYSLDTLNGKFHEVTRLTTMEFFDPDIYQSVGRLDNKGKYLATGTTEGILKLWEIFPGGSKSISPVLHKDTQAHSKGINDILFINDKNMVITAGADGCCKIFDVNTLKLLKKLSFRRSLEEKSNYSMRGMRYDSASGFLYTIQAPLRGVTYLTKWDLKNNFSPVSSILASETICTAIDLNPSYGIIALSDCQGKVVYVSVDGMMKKLKEEDVSEITIKSIAFKGENLVSGAADNSLKLNYIYKKSLISFTSFLQIIVLILFVFYLFQKYQGINKQN